MGQRFHHQSHGGVHSVILHQLGLEQNGQNTHIFCNQNDSASSHPTLAPTNTLLTSLFLLVNLPHRCRRHNPQLEIVMFATKKEFQSVFASRTTKCTTYLFRIRRLHRRQYPHRTMMYPATTAPRRIDTPTRANVRVILQVAGRAHDTGTIVVFDSKLRIDALTHGHDKRRHLRLLLAHTSSSVSAR